MAEIVNLRQQRKARARAERVEQAATNRVRHGRTKDERQRQENDAERRRRQLDGLRLDEPSRESVGTDRPPQDGGPAQEERD
ncbi:MAG: DUF4169 family protein [Tistlia sp.]|uniref:DUF4169 family protein n=1 Tax=Tistlia sp. TaxID=3057121 RepID=UPI0034A1525A